MLLFGFPELGRLQQLCNKCCGLTQTALHGLASVQAPWVAFAVVSVVANSHRGRKLDAALAPTMPSGYIWD